MQLDLSPFISILPQSAQSWALAALAFLGACSILVAPAKLILARYVPAQEWPRWVRVIDVVARVLDWCAVNTTPARNLHALAAGQKARSIPPLAEPDYVESVSELDVLSDDGPGDGAVP